MNCGGDSGDVVPCLVFCVKFGGNFNAESRGLGLRNSRAEKQFSLVRSFSNLFLEMFAFYPIYQVIN